MNYENLLVEDEGAVRTITINRPSKLNSLNRATLTELLHAVQSLAGSPAIRAVILTGSGTKAFVAGADIAEMSEMSTAAAKAFSDLGHEVCRRMEEAACPFIAAVNGFALGGGCELALACDFIYASETARFGQPEVLLGLMPGFGGTQRLSRRIGPGLARELIYTGEQVGAERARAIGLVNEVLPPGDLLTKVRTVAKSISEKAPLAVAASKRAILRGAESDLLAGNELEAQAFSSLFGTEDQREGTKAFLEKRRPTFTGR